MLSREEWLRERKKGIGGSDAATVLGISPYQTRRELALYKLGLIDGKESTPAMERGTVMEPIIADLFTKKTGVQLNGAGGIIRHPKHDHMLANFDRLTDDGRIVEIKCPGLRVFGKCKREGIPDYWITQLQHYLTFPGHPSGIFIIFNAEQWELLFFEHEPDAELQEIIVNETRVFWESLLRGEIPDEEYPAIELPNANPTDVIKIETKEWERTVKEYLEAQEIRKEAEALEDEAKGRIKTIMSGSGARIAEGAGVRAYLTQSTGRKSFDVNAARKAHPDFPFDQFMKSGKPFTSFKFYNLRGEA